MSDILIAVQGADNTWRFHNDWDVCAEQGLLHIEDFDGWYGGVSSALTPDLKRFREHGNFPAPSIRGPRRMDLVLTWHESIDAGGTAYRDASRVASGLFWDKGPYAMSVLEDGLLLSTLVQLDGEPQHQTLSRGGTQAFRIKIPLRATDPFLYGPEKSSTVLAAGTYQGLEFPLFGQRKNAEGNGILSFGTPVKPHASVSNRGNATAYPVITVTGDSPSGVRLNINGNVLDYRTPMFSQSPITFDMKGRVLEGGRDVSERLTARGWTGVGPGETVTPIITFPEGGSGFGVCTIRDTYI